MGERQSSKTMGIQRKIRYLIVSIVLLPLNISADDNLFIGLGVGSDGINALRISQQQDKGTIFNTSMRRYAEYGFNFWEGKDKNINSNSSNISISYSTILKKDIFYNFNINTGLGVAFLSDNKIGDRNLGATIQFESRLGFEYGSSNTKSVINLFHYSNAGTSSSNSGLNVLMINFSHLF